MNNITIELCAEDRARLDRLVAALENNVATRTTKKRVEKDASKSIEPDLEQVTIDDVQHTHVDETPADETPAPEMPAITETDIRSMARILIERGKKPQLKEIVNKYAPSITDIPEDSMRVVYDQLKALAGV